MILRTVLNAFIDFIWPLKCNVCQCNIKGDGKVICRNCEEGIILFSPPFCYRCGQPLFYKNDSGNRLCILCMKKRDNFDRVFVVGKYDGVLKEAIHKFKYSRKTVLKGYFADLINKYIEDHNILNKVEVVIPVPLYKTKKRERGFNQAELLAEAIGKKWKLSVLLNDLYRLKYTDPQSGLDYAQRKKNIRNAFKMKNRGSIKGKKVLLIDDIITTSATVNECSRILKEEGKADGVFVLALAAKVKDSRV